MLILDLYLNIAETKKVLNFAIAGLHVMLWWPCRLTRTITFLSLSVLYWQPTWPPCHVGENRIGKISVYNIAFVIKICQPQEQKILSFDRQ